MMLWSWMIVQALVLVGAETPARIEQVAWLQGCWQLEANGRLVEEQWMAPRGGVMLGMGRTVRDGTLVEYESVILREQDGQLAYEAHPSGQMPAVFMLKTRDVAMAVFENPAHDFPQRVGYERKDDTLSAWIEGTANGVGRRVGFLYHRVACAGSK